LFVLSPSVEVDNWGDTLLRTLQAQGLHSVVTVVAQSSTVDPKSRSDINKSLLSFIQYFVPDQTRVFDLSSSSDRLNAVRALSEGKPEDVKWREGRTWILAEKTEWGSDGKLALTGIVRGAPLSAHRLLHLPSYGDFQIAKVSCLLGSDNPGSIWADCA
jgi:pre-rRNA-processing protein TSR1